MKIEIQDYKGHTIFYDDNSDKFCCEIEINNNVNVKNTKRQSLNDVKKEIDQFIKVNFEFKPFKAFFKRYSDYDVEIIEIVGIRIDGKIVRKRGKDSFEYLGEKDFANLFEYDLDSETAIKEIENKIELQRLKYNAERKLVFEKLKPIDRTRFSM